jgi:hypothetical protein
MRYFKEPFFPSYSVTEASHKATKSPITRLYLSPSRICAVRKLEWGSEYASSPRKHSHSSPCRVSGEAKDGGDSLLLLDTQKITALSSHGLNYRQHWIKLGKGSFGTVIQAKHKGWLSSHFRSKVILIANKHI